jgi:hypothetical protein
LAVRYCKSCGYEFELQARFCSNCGTPRPTSPLTKAEPAPTLTPAEILASLKEEGEQEQAAEPPSEQSPKPGPLPGTEPLAPPRAPAASDAQPAAPDGGSLGLSELTDTIPDRAREDSWAAVAAGTCLGLLIFGLCSMFGVNGIYAFLAACFVGIVSYSHVSSDHRIHRPLSRTTPVLSRYIPQDIKVQVAARDQGRCVRCGSRKGLQYDHVTPFSWWQQHRCEQHPAPLRQVQPPQEQPLRGLRFSTNLALSRPNRRLVPNMTFGGDKPPREEPARIVLPLIGLYMRQ